MKYGYDTKNENEKIIDHYEKIFDDIIVHYTEGNNETFPDKPVFEKQILDTMHRQAVERSQSNELHLWKNAFDDDNKKLIQSLLILGVDLISIFTNSGKKFDRFLPFACFIIIFAINYKILKRDIKYIKRIKDIEKHDLYLKNEDALKKYIKNYDLYKGINNQIYELNINTLNSINMSDLKKIIENYEKIKETENIKEKTILKRK